jgi:UDP-GlcNAc3NAcA epimerase
MTGRMMIAMESEFEAFKPDWILVYGDTNSTLAGALSAAKLHIPIAHVEAGLRSYNRQMPEEINRVLTDHISTLLFAPTETAVVNLQKEGISSGVAKVGDVMYDEYLFLQQLAAGRSSVLKELDLQPKSYFLATIHRQENTGDFDRLSIIFKAFEAIAEENCPLVIPSHPRTRDALNHFKIKIASNSHIRLIEPVSYMEMIQLVANARIIFTDSGGVQKEAYFAGIPCVTLRDETEWVETIQNEVNFLAGADVHATIAAYKRALTVDVQLKNGIYGDGHAAEKIVATLISAQ